MNNRTVLVATVLVALAILGVGVWLLDAAPTRIPGKGPGDGGTAAGSGPGAGLPEEEPPPAPRLERAWVLRGTGSVAGSVREYGTDRPLGGVRVQLRAGVPGPGETLETKTLADGSFLLEKVPNFDAWTLVGLVDPPLAELTVESVEVLETRLTDLGILYATPAFKVPGIVVDEAGKAVPGATVRAVRGRPEEVRMDFLRVIRELPRPHPAVESVVTGPDGRFVLEKLIPGTYDLEVSCSGYRLTAERGVIVEPLAEGRELRIVLPGGFALKGRVLRRTEGPIEGLRVVAAPQPDNDREIFEIFAKSNAVTDEKGEFVLEGLGPGTCFVAVESPGEPFSLALNVEIPRDGFLEIVIEGDATLEGRVTDAAGEPVPSAQVYIANLNNTAPVVGVALTDAEGRYRMAGLRSGPVQLFMVQAEGFGTYPEEIMSVLMGRGSELILRPGPNRKDVTLGAGATVKGLVLEAGTRTPVEGVRVSLATPASFFGGTRSGNSDAEGRFVVRSVPLGPSMLVASKDGWMQPGLTPQTMMANAMKFVAGPGAGGDPGEGISIVVSEPGQVIERTLEMARGSMVSGTVVAPSGEPVPGARVTVELSTGARGPFRQLLSFFPLGEPRLAGPDGSFEVPAPPPGQSFVLAARAQGYLDTTSESLTAPAGENLSGVVLKLRQGATLRGKVAGPDGKPLEGALVRYTPEEEGQDWGRRWRLRNARPHMTGGDGTFTIPNVETGNLTVQFSHPRYASDSRSGVEVEEGRTVELEARLGPALSISGKATGPDGRPFTGTRIDVTRKDALPEGADPLYETPDDIAAASDGSFTVTGLLPGRYSVFARAEGAADSEAVEVEAGGAPLSLRLKPAYSISGVVRTRGGAALANVRVEAFRTQGEDRDREGSANSTREGNFEIRDLPAGTYEVRAEAGWGIGSSRPNLVPVSVENVAAGTQDLLLEVEEGLRIAGTVTRADGTPVAEGWVNARQILPAGSKGEPVSASGGFLDGKFELTGLVPGKYTLGTGANDLPWKTTEVEAGTLDVKVVYGAGGTVEGRVTYPDGSAVAGVWVSATGEGGGGSGTQSGSDGRYRIQELPPGSYAVAVRAEKDGVNHFARIEGITVDAGTTTTGVDLALVPVE